MDREVQLVFNQKVGHVYHFKVYMVSRDYSDIKFYGYILFSAKTGTYVGRLSSNLGNFDLSPHLEEIKAVIEFFEEN